MRSRLSRKQPQDDSGEESEPLGKLRLRCVVGVGICLSTYLAAVITSVLWPSTLSMGKAISIEVGIGIVGLLLAMVAIVIWLLTESTAFVLSVSKAVAVASAANAALESELRGDAGPDGTPIPIQRGRDLRRHRTDRHAG